MLIGDIGEPTVGKYGAVTVVGVGVGVGCSWIGNEVGCSGVGG
jgi:hypothetical protein